MNIEVYPVINLVRKLINELVNEYKIKLFDSANRKLS